MFNHLGIAELARVAEGNCSGRGGCWRPSTPKEVQFAEVLPLCLVLREGGASDARTVRSRAEDFVKEELLRFSRLSRPERLKEVLWEGTLPAVQ